MPEQSSLADLLSLSGRTAVITGAATGIGFAIAKRLAETGAHVVLADVNPSVHASAEKLLADGARASAVELDVTDPAAAHRVADEVAAEHGSLDIWVNNAGVYPVDPALTVSPEQWRRVLSVNLDGAFFCSQAAGAKMVDQKRGVILNVGSTAGFRVSQDGYAHYAASKSALRGLTQAFARELGPSGVRVLGIAPSVTETDEALSALERHAERASIDTGTKVTAADVTNKYLEKIPLRRSAEPDDMAVVAAFCVSDLAGFMSGSFIPVDGGYLAV